ncbi:MAG: CoA transferase [Gammaproteobacteria bacterium]|nr:CoA transferase [Gammaproteobacteria bacterium]
MESALSGIKVVELGIAIQGPAAGMYLAEHGAEVIKIETPVGEENRHHFGYGKSLPKAVPAPQFVANNRGKRLMTLDAKGELGREVLRRLIAKADVFLTNYRENALNRLGLGYEELHRLNPRLIYAIASGFGSKGPVADRAMLDPMAQARGGLVSVTGSPDRPQVLAGAAMADTTGAAQLIVGILTALLARERHGVGQRVGTSSYGAQLWHQAFELTYTSMTGYVPRSSEGIHPLAPGGSSGVFRTADGGAVAFLDTLSPEVWTEFCERAGKPELARDARWDSAYKRLSTDNPDALRLQVAEIFASRTTAEWEAFFSDPYLMFQRVFDYEDVLDDPQALENGYISEIELPEMGRTKVVGNTIELSETPPEVRPLACELGEHTEAILLEYGYGPAEVSEILKETEDAKSREFQSGGLQFGTDD